MTARIALSSYDMNTVSKLLFNKPCERQLIVSEMGSEW